MKELKKRRQRRRFRVRNKIKRVSNRPRLSVFRSHKHIYAQLIDDEKGHTIAAASTTEKAVREEVGYGGNVKAAQVVGRLIAERAKAAGVEKAVFDRGGYRYHGRVAALADAARDAGLDLGAKKVVEAPKEEEKSKKGKKGGKKK
ncbi:MAG: 50S ribosomal protein L18 [Planctomycetota bacterium]|nr:MAG: 50S ribosomal protein L18 [Planctomycetota bacterium]